MSTSPITKIEVHPTTLTLTEAPENYIFTHSATSTYVDTVLDILAH